MLYIAENLKALRKSKKMDTGGSGGSNWRITSERKQMGTR